MKSENAVLIAKSPTAILKLADFGLCKDLAAALNGKDRFCGMLNYIPPQGDPRVAYDCPRGLLCAWMRHNYEMVERKLLFDVNPAVIELEFSM